MDIVSITKNIQDDPILKAKLRALFRAQKNTAQQRLRPGYKEYIAPIQRKHVLQRYGLTHENYLKSLKEQDGKCAVCRAEKAGNGKGDKYLDVDHNHSTGKVRGLLCRNCNITLGVIEKKKALIVKLEAYLAWYNEFDPD